MLSVAPSLARLSVHDFAMAVEHVLSVSARLAGKLDFVSASVWRADADVEHQRP